MAVAGSREGRGKPQKREDDDDRKRFRLKNQGLYKKYIIFVTGTKIYVMPAKFLYLWFIFLAIPCSLSARDNQTDSLIRLVDKAVSHSGEYIAQKEKRITLLRSQLRKVHDGQAAYNAAGAGSVLLCQPPEAASGSRS